MIFSLVRLNSSMFCDGMVTNRMSAKLERAGCVRGNLVAKEMPSFRPFCACFPSLTHLCVLCILKPVVP